jgi:hypothetical protein
VGSIELGECRMPMSRPANTRRHGGATVEAETVPGWVASSEKSVIPSRPPIERVIQITQALLENQSIEDAPTREMTPCRPQNTLQCRFKAIPSQEPALSSVI